MNSLKKTLLLSSVLLSCAMLVREASAQYYINNDVNIPTDFTGFNAVAGDGLIVNSSNGSSAWNATVDQNFTANNNTGYGIKIVSGGKVNFINNTTSLLSMGVSNNNTTLAGISVDGGGTVGSAVFSTTGLDVSSIGNGKGIIAIGGAKVDITGSTSLNNKLTIKDNLSGDALLSENAGTVFNVTNMDIDIIDNDNGIAAYNSGAINFTGKTDGSNTLNSQNKNGEGIIATGSSSVIIKNMDVNTIGGLGQKDGLKADGNSTITLEGISAGTNKFVSDNNGAYGILSMGGSTISINDMDISTSGNSTIGIWAGSGTVKINSSTGNNKLISDSNTLYGLEVNGDSVTGPEFLVSNVNAQFNNNGSHNIIVNNGGNAEFTGNSNTFLAQNGGGHGVFVDNGSTFTVTNMNVDVSSNAGDYNIHAVGGSTITLTGDGSQTVTSNNNTNALGGVGLIFDTLGTMTITGMSVVTNSNLYGVKVDGKTAVLGATLTSNQNTNDGISIVNNGLLKIYHSYAANSMTINQNGANGINLDAGAIDIKEYILSLEDNTLAGVLLNNASTFDIQGGSARAHINLRNNGTYGIDNNGSTANLLKTNILITDNIGIRNNANGIFNFSDGTISSGNDVVFFTDSGTGTYNLTDANVNSFIDVLKVDNSGTADLNLTTSRVEGSMNVVNAATDTINLDLGSSTWIMNNNSEITKLTADSDSKIDLRSATSGSYNNLKMKDFSGSAVTFVLNTVLGGDGSPTDFITITNSITGTGILDVIMDPASLGAATVDGIKLVDANGVSSAANSFTLAGGVMDTADYEYDLYQGDKSGIDTDSFFLRSTGKLTNTSNTAANAPALLMSIAKVGFNSLHKRMGELRHNSGKNKNGAWVRQYSNNLHINDKIASNVNIHGLEAGYDKQIISNCDYKVYAGLMTGYLSTDNIKTKLRHNNIATGTGHGHSPTIGMYGTYVNRNGIFVDATARTFWDELHMTTYTSTGIAIDLNPKRQVHAFSLEGGKRFDFYKKEKSSFNLEPKLGLYYAVAASDNSVTSNGNRLHYSKTESLMTRFITSFGYSHTLSTGSIIEPYIQAGLINEYAGKTDIRYVAANYESDISGFSYQVGGGLNTQFNDYLSLYSEVTFEKGKVIESLTSNVGIRYTW